MRSDIALRVVALGLAALLSPLVAMPAPAQSTRNGAQVHQVQRGDTLLGIAGRYGVTIGSILAANGLKFNDVRLKPGQRLTIPAPNAVTHAKRPAVRRAHAVAVSARMPRDFFLAVPRFQDLVPPPFQWPVDGPLTSMFGRRRLGWHRGIDIKADPGTPVLAAATGLVVASFVEPRYGNVVKVAHDNGFVTVYAHNERNLVDVGDWVAAAQTIAAVGRTGRATSEHLHFEIRHEGLVYNPLYLLPLPPRITQIEDADQGEHDEDS